MARPTKLTPELIEKAQDYLENYSTTYGDIIPTIAGLACELKIARETVYDWSKKEDNKEFSDIVIEIMSSQERKLVNGGLSSTMNPTIAKLLLSKHGYSDSVKTDVSSSDGSMTPPAPIYTIVNE